MRGRVARIARATAKLLVVWVGLLCIAELVAYLRFRRGINRLPIGAIEPARLAADAGLPVDVARAVGIFDVRSPGLGELGPRPDGEIRIVAYGDSFTAGAEVPGDLSFPALLARQLTERGASNVRVISLGTGWHSFAQQYRIWDRFGRGLESDFILFGPHCAFLDREHTFEHTNGRHSGYLHGRYVLRDDGELAFVDVPGERLQDRIDAYFGLFPRAETLRFDRTPPVFIRAWLPAGKIVSNPFYYSRLTQARESSLLYTAMLSSLGRDDDVAVLNVHPYILDAARAAHGHVTIAELDMPSGFLALRAQGHYSSLGNRVVAGVYLAELEGKREADFDWFRIERWDGGRKEPLEFVPLDTVSKTTIAIAGRAVGALYRSKPGVEELADFRRDGIGSLVAFASGEDFPLDVPLWPLKGPLPVGKRFTLKVQTSSGTVEIASGPLEAIAPGVSIGVARLPGIVTRTSHRQWGTELALQLPRGEVVSASLELEPGLTLASHRQVEGLFLQIQGVTPVLATALYDEDIDPRAIAHRSPVTINLAGAKSQTLVIGQTVHERRTMPIERSGMRRRLHMLDGKAEIVRAR